MAIGEWRSGPAKVESRPVNELARMVAEAHTHLRYPLRRVHTNLETTIPPHYISRVLGMKYRL